MPRILKRPMFRSGGSTNEGIMHGLVDRKGYGIGGIDREKLKADTQTISDLLAEFAPISKTRVPYGQFGLNIASGMSITDALKDPYKQFTTADDARRALLAKREQGALSTALAGQLKKPKTPTTKAVRNISKETLFGIPPGGEGLISNAQALSVPGKFKASDTRMITLPDGRTMPYEEYKIQNTNESKARSLATQQNILGGFIGDMKARLPGTPTSVVGYGFAFVEGVSDQLSQVAEGLGVKEVLTIDDEKFDKYLDAKGFTAKAANFATMKGSVINLGYALAKIAEPNNPRLSEGDIIRQLNRINFGLSRKVFAASLDQILKEEGIRAVEEIEGMRLDPDDFFNVGKDTKGTTGTGQRGMEKDDNPLDFPEDKLAPIK